MNKRLAYWTALAVTGLVSLALQIWLILAWIDQNPAWTPFREQHGFHPGFGLMGFGFVVLVGLWIFFRSRRNGVTPLDPLGDLAGEYVEGRIDRAEFFRRKAVLEEQS